MSSTFVDESSRNNLHSPISTPRPCAPMMSTLDRAIFFMAASAHASGTEGASRSASSSPSPRP